MSIDVNSPDFKKGEIIGKAVGETFLEQRVSKPHLREIARKMRTLAKDLAGEMGCDPTRPAVLAAALLCALAPE